MRSLTLKTLRDSLGLAAPSEDLDAPLTALWHAAHGDWARAHQIIQDEAGTDAAWIHAWLHRQEGDLGNAAYWYRRAGRPPATGSLDGEWDTIVEALLARNADTPA
ncbi:MAG: hypothetical protein ABI794_17575 [Betaproteobacteria bacterium]